VKEMPAEVGRACVFTVGTSTPVNKKPEITKKRSTPT
jgi:hypothetical protein